MKQILDAIIAGDTAAEDFAALEIPQSYKAVTVHKDEVDMFDGLATRDKDPRKSLHVEDVPAARARPGRGPGRGDGQRDQLQHRVDLDLRADVDLRLPRALRAHLSPGGQARPAVPRGGLRPRRRRAAHRPRRARLEARRRGRRALPLGRAGEPRRPRRHDARPGAADLGLRDQLRRARRAGPGQGQPADAEARPPHLGGGGQPRAGQLHRLPAAGQPQRRRHEAGRHRADLGRQRRPRRLRHPVRPQRRRHPGLRGLLPGEGRASAARWAPSWSSTGARRTTGSGRTSTPRTRRSGAGSARRSAS